MRKIYVVPNLVTTANMACGFYSMVATGRGDFVGAAWAILGAAVFDMLDGRIARLARATSEFGVQYDSLSDLVSFGVAPGLLLLQWALHPFERLGWLAAFLFVACGALRLARFNVTTSRLPKGYFQGLPIPIAAGALATFVIFVHAPEVAPHFQVGKWEVLGIDLFLASLMVSSIPFPSFKELNWRSSASFGYLMVGVLAIVLLAAKIELSFFTLHVVYIGGTLAWHVGRVIRGEPRLIGAPTKEAS